MRRPLILVTSFKRALPTYLGDRTLLYTLAVEYVDALRAAGATPLIVPNIDGDDAYRLLDQVDALVLTGGGDVDPASYDEANQCDGAGASAAADATELALIRAAATLEMPTLGICRGMQLLNVALGGTLSQEVTVEGSEIHPPLEGDEAILGFRHPVDVAEGTELARAIGGGRHMVNSIHHQGIAIVAPDLRPVAWASDGLVEAVEYAGSWPALGVQWHPERLAAPSRRALFDWFVSLLVVDARARRPTNTA